MSSIIEVETIELNAVPNLGDLLGTSGQSAISSYINKIDDRTKFFGSTYDVLQNSRQAFIEQLVNPIKQAGASVNTIMEQYKAEVTSEDLKIKPIDSIEELKKVSPRMFLPILTYDPVFKLLKQGRIDGYGLSFDQVKPIKEVYDRLIRENGSKITNLPFPKYAGITFLHSIFESTDPKFEIDEIDAILDSQEFIDELLDETELDPTNPDTPRN